MTVHSRAMLGLAAAFMLTAAAADAQGKSKEKAKGKETKELHQDRDAQGRVIVRTDRDRDGRVVYGNGAKTPPGLAKKPGGMPPGQYKKRYTTTEGSSVLRDILLGRGYTVVRVDHAGPNQYVYYRLRDGSVRRAVVSPGEEQLTFSNLPQSLVREVLLRLY